LRQKKPQHKTTSDFFGAMNAEHDRYALRCLQARQPSLQTPSRIGRDGGDAVRFCALQACGRARRV